jgi:DNA-directed RNA polymerase specialized sigma24 family protein
VQAEEYVKRIKKIDALTRNKQSEIDRLRAAATGLAGFASGESVQSTKNPHKSQDAIAKYCDLESEISALTAERKAIIKTLEKLPTLDYDFLFKLYAEDYTLKELASEFKRSYDWAKWKKRNALEKLQAILDEEKSTV